MSASTFGLITRSANPLMKNIHNDGDNRGRMPLFLPLKLSKEFLAEDLPMTSYRELLNYEMPSEDLDYHPVYTIRTPKLRPDEQPKTKYWQWDKLPELVVGNPD